MGGPSVRAAIVQREAERSESEVPKADILALFEREFVNVGAPLRVAGYQSHSSGNQERHDIQVQVHGTARTLSAEGSGPIDAFVSALQQLGVTLAVEDFSVYPSVHSLQRI